MRNIKSAINHNKRKLNHILLQTSLITLKKVKINSREIWAWNNFLIMIMWIEVLSIGMIENYQETAYIQIAIMKITSIKMFKQQHLIFMEIKILILS